MQLKRDVIVESTDPRLLFLQGLRTSVVSRYRIGLFLVQLDLAFPFDHFYYLEILWQAGFSVTSCSTLDITTSVLLQSRFSFRRRITLHFFEPMIFSYR